MFICNKFQERRSTPSNLKSFSRQFLGVKDTMYIRVDGKSLRLFFQEKPIAQDWRPSGRGFIQAFLKGGLTIIFLERVFRPKFSRGNLISWSLFVHRGYKELGSILMRLFSATIIELVYTFPMIKTLVIQNDCWVGMYANARVTSAREAKIAFIKQCKSPGVGNVSSPEIMPVPKLNLTTLVNKLCVFWFLLSKFRSLSCKFTAQCQSSPHIIIRTYVVCHDHSNNDVTQRTTSFPDLRRNILLRVSIWKYMNAHPNCYPRYTGP